MLLVGDVFALFKPHVAASTNQAAMQAMGLAEVFEGKRELVEWERGSVEYAMRTAKAVLSRAFGEYCFTGNVPGSLSTAIQPDDESK